jgi:hypothetical protein
MPQRFLSIRNLEKYQTNRKQNPPWFKIHRVMFGDPEFVKLSTAYRFLYIGLIHLAVESGNKIYNDDTFILQRLYIPSTDGILKTYKGHTKLDLTPLYRAGFLYTTNLSRVLSEGEREGEREREESREEGTALASQSLMVDTVVDLWNKIPGVVKPKSITGPIRKRLLACLDKQPDSVWWTTYFDKIKDSAFLTGRKTDFAATLDWVLGPKNMAKILAGNYDDRAPVIKESAIMEQARAFLGRG